jgi:hypothetical protein
MTTPAAVLVVERLRATVEEKRERVNDQVAEDGDQVGREHDAESRTRSRQRCLRPQRGRRRTRDRLVT